MARAVRLVLVGNPEPFHVGAHLRDAANALGIPVTLCDTRAAFEGAWLTRQWHWRVRGHAPARMSPFNAQVLAACDAFRATHLLATGLAPLTDATLRKLRAHSIQTLNFLTDDPWNPLHRAEWFLRAVREYDAIFTPRRANENDLRDAGCARVEFLPFAYNPFAHFPDPAPPDEKFACDVFFAGGADAERAPYGAALVRAGFDTHLFGGYWERYADTRRAARGHADLPALRRAVKNARVCLNLVRRANRDDHVMRTFEIPAMRGCMLTEDTAQHRAWFGAEGESVLYFQTPQEMVERVRWLLARADERARLAGAAHERITHGKHTYRDRLAAMLDLKDKEHDIRF